MTTATDYSGMPLAKKLGIKAGFRLRISHAPSEYSRNLAPVPDGVTISSSIRTRIDVWHLFTRSRPELAKALPRMIRGVRPGGAIWVSWPKKSSAVASTVTEDTVRELALPLGLVDVKVFAIDETWSGLKLVLRKELRPLQDV